MANIKINRAPEWKEREQLSTVLTDHDDRIVSLEGGGGGGGQAGIQFQDEGVNLGTSATATSVDFVGAGVTATRVSNAVTVTIPGGQAAVQYQDEGANLGTSGTVTAFNVVGAGAIATRAANTVTLTVAGGNALIQFQDEGSNLGTSGTVDTVNVVGAGATATRVGNTVTITIPGGGGSGATGTTTVNFGAFPGSFRATAVIADTGVTLTSSIKVLLLAQASPEHTADEHIMASTMLDLIAGDVTAGVGFTIYAVARELGREPLEQPRRRFHAANATALQNQSSSGGVFGSVGGRSLSLLNGRFNVVWERT